MNYRSGEPNKESGATLGFADVPDECVVCGSSGALARIGDDARDLGEFARSKSRSVPVRSAVFSCAECGMTYELSE